MTEADYARKLDELDRLLNDPDVPMQPRRIWTLLADVSQFVPRDDLRPPAAANVSAGLAVAAE